MFLKYNIDILINNIKPYKGITNKKANFFYKRKNILNQLSNYIFIFENLKLKEKITYLDLIKNEIDFINGNKKEILLTEIYKEYYETISEKEKEDLLKAIRRNKNYTIMYYFINKKIYYYNNFKKIQDIIKKISNKVIKERKEMQQKIYNQIDNDINTTLKDKRKLRQEFPFSDFMNNLLKHKDIAHQIYEIFLKYKFFPFINYTNNLLNININENNYLKSTLSLNTKGNAIFTNITNKNILLLNSKYILDNNINFLHHIIISYILYNFNKDNQLNKKVIISKSILQVKKIFYYIENKGIHLVDFFTNNKRFIINHKNSSINKKRKKIYFNNIIQDIIKKENKHIYVYFNEKIYKFVFKNNKTENLIVDFKIL